MSTHWRKRGGDFSGSTALPDWPPLIDTRRARIAPSRGPLPTRPMAWLALGFAGALFAAAAMALIWFFALLGAVLG